MIHSNIRLFADDTIIYLIVSNRPTARPIRLTELEKWETEWLMAFNPEECEVIRIVKKKTPIIFDYTLHGIILKKPLILPNTLRVNISHNLSWAKHINQITTKTNTSLTFIKMNIRF